MLQPVSHRKRDAVDSFKSALGCSVVQKQALLKAPQLNVLYHLDAEVGLFCLTLVEPSKSRVCPSASCPLFVISVVHLNPSAKVSTQLCSISQMRSMSSKAAHRKVCTEAPRVRTPRDAFLHHRRELYAAVLPSLWSEILCEANRVGHLRISQLEQLADRGCCTWSAPSAGTLPRPSGLSDTHCLPNCHIISNSHCLKDLSPARVEAATDSQGAGNKHGSRVSLGSAMSIIHVEERTRVGVQKNGPLQIQRVGCAPDNVCTPSVDFADGVNDAWDGVVLRSSK
mmetsp:Transcript_35382/g.77435  ORF Transcript_35382/g.77435 Transcript_35382/m.77435 type:complete len:283 (-) Transcript_35382:166-1014(-)